MPHALEGSVRRAGNRVRITTQLILDCVNHWSADPDGSLTLGREIADRAVQLDASEPQAHCCLGTPPASSTSKA